MPNDDSAALNISRRKTLAALGTIGVASAGAGLGTSAYFSDQETFENNSLTAGTLDLVVDWEEHYSDWSDDESDGIQGDILMSPPETPADYTSFPPGTDAEAVDDNDDNDDPLIWVPNEDVGTFMDNTSIEAFPDVDDDGVQDEFPEGADPCEFLANVGNDDSGLDPIDGARTENDDTVIGEEEPAPLINLDDVKPGDFGEITLSAHLCGNPGYLWLNGGLVSASENGVTEPEGDDPQEDGDADSTDPADVELLDTVQTALWYDNNCDNLVARGEGEDLDVVLAVDTSGSLDSGEMDLLEDAAVAFKNQLQSGDQLGLATFAGDADYVDLNSSNAGGQNGDAPVMDDVSNITDGDIESAIPDDGSGNTHMAGGIYVANDILDNEGRGGQEVIVLFTDGEPNITSGANQVGPYNSQSFATNDDDNVTAQAATDAKNSGGTRIVTVGLGQAGDTFLQTQIASSIDDHAAVNDATQLQEVLESLAAELTSAEEVFFRGTLAELASELGTDNGIPLDFGRDSPFNEVGYPPNGGSDPENSDARECYPPDSTECIGLSWWLPVDHANEIQSDTVTFDLGFYTEQCRHNDGGGMNNDAVGNSDELDA